MNRIEEGVRSFGIRLGLSPSIPYVHVLVFCAIILLGVFARTWEYRSLPPGLNQDEAASGVDAYSLLHYGVDRNGVSFPIYFISYGSGQSAVHIYLLLPFIALAGLTPFAVRLPVLLTAILNLPVAYLIGRRVLGNRFGLVAMFLLAIAPWHVLMSRWGIESNLLPFFFSVAFLLLLKSIQNNRWFIPAMAGMAVCLYVYGPAYAAIPVFLILALPIILLARRIDSKYILAGMVAFLLVALPIAVFMLVNNRQWSSLHLGPLTIPRLPTKPRYEIVAGLSKGGFLPGLRKNIWTFATLLWTQTDNRAYNVVEPYGYLYPFALPLVAIGTVMLIPRRREQRGVERLLLIAWLVSGGMLGVLQSANMTRINLLFLPLTFCVAAFLAWLVGQSKFGLLLGVVPFLVAFILFTRAYHGPEYRAAARETFFDGILPAVEYASSDPLTPVCVTDKVSEPQIYVLFTQKLNPLEYVDSVKYGRPHGGFLTVLQLDRFSFGLQNCGNDPRTTYVLRDEKAPLRSVVYASRTFGLFTVYKPIAISGVSK